MNWEIEFLVWLQKAIPCKPFFAAVTHLGDAGVFWILLGLYLLIAKRDKKTSFHMFVAIALMFLIVNIALKPWIARIRPFDVYPVNLLVNPPHDYSFPSGHTAVSFASCFVLGECYPKSKVFMYGLAGLIAFSRMVLFVHYPTDILGGIVIGLVCGMISMKTFKF